MEKIIKITSLFLLITMNVYAQTDEITAYEQARYDLADKTIVKICEPLTEYEMTAFILPLANELKKADNIFDQTAILEGVIVYLCELSEFFKVDQSYASNSLNLYSYEQYVLQSWHALGKWYMEEREKLDKTKTELDAQREEERNQMRELKNTPYYKFLEEISNDFETWAIRGNYERTIDYENRMANRAIIVFDSICYVKSGEFWKRNIELCLNGYNPDTEKQRVALIYKDKTDLHYVEVEFVIPLEQAEDYHKCTRRWRLGDGYVLNFNYDAERSYAKSLCVIDNHIYPLEADFYITEPYEFHDKDGQSRHWISIELTIDSEPLIIVCDDLKIIKPEFAKYLKGHVFRYVR